MCFFFFFQAEDGIRDLTVTGVQTCALPILAETFLSANKEYPSSKKAPDMLLKLGVSLVGLDQKDVACATFSEIGKRYPDISGVLKERVKQEQALAAC